MTYAEKVNEEIAISKCGLIGWKHAGGTCRFCEPIKEALTAKDAHYQSKLALMESVVERARYLCYTSKYESLSEVCYECGTYGYGELRDALRKLDEVKNG
jgi:hypothetical protein